ncbi:UPF0481 protein At3g47200-like isoform X1 [Prosopis cineraria]|uniref:UPF0481 protein At3g47200-like isoform X1 n=1 Tax=Prosopis cineraria TaxID=364024 RepID=UPI00240F9E18|nr:UPF0481 protein At3g47200-like isoform X1 [Prosopis cineraria]
MEPYFWTVDILLHGAKQLQEFGVKFKASKSKSLLDIKFSGHLLELPQILIAEPLTRTLFHNMIAFEQIHSPLTTYISNYATMWGCLINTQEDADVLIDTKIMRNFEPDTEVVSLFRIMGQNVYEARMISEYIDIFKRLNQFSQNPLNQGKATLRGDCCKNP